VAATVFHLDTWSRGQLPQGDISLAGVEQVMWGGYSLALAMYARRWGEQAIEQFRLMLTPELGSIQLLRYRMTRTQTWPSVLGSALTVACYMVFAPSLGLAIDASAPLAILSALWAWVIAGFAAALVIHQMREVSRLLALIPQLRLFQLKALYSLSRLTQRTALAVAILVVLGWLLVSRTMVESRGGELALIFALVQTGFIAILFVSPLWGTHRRLVEAKQSQLEQNAQRMVTVLERLQLGVERDDGAIIDRQHKALLAIQFEQQALAKVPTWPWAPGTLRGMLGAILLPVILWLAQFTLEKLFR
jgi:hypothetical protein